MVCRRKRKTISHMVAASRCSHGKDMSGIHQTKLYTGDCAAMTISKKNALSESIIFAQDYETR
jgi:hypothetical protein